MNDKNNKITNLDTDQVIKMTYEEDHDAQRVFLVGGQKLELNVDTSQITDAIKDSLKDIKIEQKSNDIIPLLTEIEKPIYIYKTQIVEIEKQVFIPQIEIKEIEKQIIIKEIQTKEIQIPIISKEYEIIEIEKESSWIKALIILQSLTTLLILIKLFK